MEMMTHTRRIGALAVLLTIALSGSGMSGSGLGVASTAQAPAAGAAEVRTWYFYTVKWGSQDEFLDLFQRNHYPVLKARMEAGHYFVGSNLHTALPRRWPCRLDVRRRARRAPGVHGAANRSRDREEALSRSGQVPPGRTASLRAPRSALGHAAHGGGFREAGGQSLDTRLRAQGSRLRQDLRPHTRGSCLSPEP